jgi:RecB family exonuclease
MAVKFNLAKQGISYTLLSTWLECRQKALYYMQGIKPVRLQMPLVFGSLFHSLLELVYKDGEFTLLSQEDARGAALIEVRKYAKKYGDAWSEKELTNWEILVAQIIVLFPAYISFYADEDDCVWEEVESKFSIPFKGFLLTGRLDGVYQLADDSYWVMDTKVKGRIDGVAIDSTLSRDMQMHFYMLAAKQIFGVTPGGICQNVVRRPQLRRKKTETLGTYSGRIAEHIEEDPAHYFKRFEYATTEQDLLAFEKELIEMLCDFKSWVRKQKVRLFGQPCHSRYGLCPFVPLCYDGRDDLYGRSWK